jgi:hypothetical protein
MVVCGAWLGGALGAGAAGAGGCAWPRWPAAGPLVGSSARICRVRPRRGLSSTSTRNPASPDTCTGRAAKWARRVRGRRRLCRRGRAAAFVPAACGAAAWQASDTRRGRALGRLHTGARRRPEGGQDGDWRLCVAAVPYYEASDRFTNPASPRAAASRSLAAVLCQRTCITLRQPPPVPLQL